SSRVDEAMTAATVLEPPIDRGPPRIDDATQLMRLEPVGMIQIEHQPPARAEDLPHAPQHQRVVLAGAEADTVPVAGHHIERPSEVSEVTEVHRHESAARRD